MEKLDAAIGIVGALVILGALGAVSLQRPDSGFEVNFVERELALGEGSQEHVGEAAFTDVYDFEVTDPLAARVVVLVRAEFVGTPAGASLRASLRAPNGTTYERESVPQGSPTGSRASAAVEFKVDAAPQPPAHMVMAASAEEAERIAAEAAAGREAMGVWTLEVGFSSFLPPANSVTSSWEGRLASWVPRAQR